MTCAHTRNELLAAHGCVICLAGQLDEALADYAACAHAVGVEYEADGHASEPGPVADVVRAIEEAVAGNAERLELQTKFEAKHAKLVDVADKLRAEREWTERLRVYARHADGCATIGSSALCTCGYAVLAGTAPETKQISKVWSDDDVEAILRNVGWPTTCGACMCQALTGSNGYEHTCGKTDRIIITVGADAPEMSAKTSRDWENMSDEDWSSRLAKRISGATGETWFGNGIEQAILVAMRRARARGFAAAVEAAAKLAEPGELSKRIRDILALRPPEPR